MDMHRQRPFTRFAALTLVVGGHVLLVLLFSGNRPAAMRTMPSASHSPGTLIFVELSSPQAALPAKSKSNARSAMRRRDRSGVESEPGAPIETPPQIPKIDWRLEAERTARDMAPELMEQEGHKCQNPDLPGLLPPECRKRNYKSEWEWEPEPKRVGMQGLLPYVRLGKRCIVGLGFFGCAVGKLPEADGRLFDDMRDPNRPKSSVPDIPGHEPAP